jgi:hypothetical protein
MFLVVGIAALVLFIAVLVLGSRRHGPILLLLAAVALGCLGVIAVFEAFFQGFYLMDYPSDYPTEVAINLVLLWSGLISIPVAIVLVIASGVWAARNAGRNVRRRR